MNKRIISILLSLAAILSSICACESPNGVPEVSTTESTAEPDTSQMLILADGEKSDYTIVRSDFAESALTSACVALRSSITALAGGQPDITNDYDRPPSEGAKEILVGDTNRPESKAALAELEEYSKENLGDAFAICTSGDSLIIIGTSDAATIRAIDHFTENYIKVSQSTVTVDRNTEVIMSVLKTELANKDVIGSPLKKQYSDYVTSYTETPLLNFDNIDYKGADLHYDVGSFEVDKEYQREGEGALRFIMGDNNKELVTLMWYGGRSFEFSAADRHKTTLKLWLFLDDADKFASDHDAGYGRQASQATFFFRVFDRAGRVYCWNHTLTGNGWHEVELSFNIHNGMDPNFDFEHIVGFGLLTFADEGTVIELDDLRGVHYTTDYTPESAPNGGRLICDCEYNALDGLIVQEWYGCAYDKEDKLFGESSVVCRGDTSVNDFRTIIANLDIPMSYGNDVLVFYMKVDRIDEISSLFIELNEEQDVHEYERGFTKEELFGYGLSQNDGEWSEVRIPISTFKKNLRPDIYGDSEDITLCNARFVISGVARKSYTVHYDRIYLATKDALGIN